MTDATGMFETTADRLPRLMNCNGSVNMPVAPTFTPDDHTVRNEGVAAHYMANAVFRQEFTFDELIDRKAPNGVFITAEMTEHVCEYLSALDCGQTEVETTYFHGTAWRIAGRADHIRYNDATGVLTVDDFKYGFRVVEPEMNWTLISHAIGWCFINQRAPIEIVLRIHQPRAWHPEGKLREWRLTYAQLMDLYATINTTLCSLSDTLNTGDWCRKCHALGVCPAARLARMNAIDASTRALPDDIPDDALSLELDTIATALATLTNQKKALDEMALFRVKNQARVIENYSALTQYADRRWKAGFTGQLLSVMTGKDLTTAPKAVTPAEAIRRGVPESVVASLAERPQTGVKLVRETPTQRAKRLLKQGN